jgi:hypothetical protein
MHIEMVKDVAASVSARLGYLGRRPEAGEHPMLKSEHRPFHLQLT